MIVKCKNGLMNMTCKQMMWHYESSVCSFCCIYPIWKVCNSWWGIFPLKLQRPRSLLYFVHILNDTKKPKGTKLRLYIGEGFVTYAFIVSFYYAFAAFVMQNKCYAHCFELLPIFFDTLWYIRHRAMQYIDLCKWV